MRKVDKPWGHEEIWAETDRYVGKVLHIRAGRRLSLQHHEQKDETIRVLEGVMELTLEGDDGELALHRLAPGDARRIAPGKRHRMRAVSDCDVLEVSTPELDDVVRHEDDFGRTA